ncbi:hypothetical protein MP638_000897 [Amoeboaphelidium occidentale]|nr:hypothetical protein MP638_000897 [Amoeboaphelidium occidentale]
MAEDVNIIVTRSMAKRQRSEADDPVSTKKLVVSQEDSTSGSNISTRWFGNLWDNVLLYGKRVLTNIKNACGLHKVAADSTVTNVEVNILDTDSTEHYERLSVVKTSLSFACKNRPVYGRLVSEKIKELAQKIGSIRYHTSRYLNYLVIRLLEDKVEVPKLSTGQDGILRYCFKLFLSDSTLETKNSEIKRLRALIEKYAVEYRTKSGLKNLDAVSMAGFSQILASVVDKYQVGIKQHVSVNLFRKLKRYIQWRLQQQNAKLYTSNSRSAKAALYVIKMVQFSQKVFVKRLPTVPKQLLDLVNEKKFKHLTEQEITDELNGMVVEYSRLQSFNHVLPSIKDNEITNNNNNKISLTSSTQPPTMLTRKRTRSQRLDSDPEDDPQDQDYNPEDDMQKISCEFYANYETDAARRVMKRQRGKGLRLFNLLPVTKLRAGGFDIQTIHLYEVLKSIKETNSKLCNDIPSKTLKFMDNRTKGWRSWIEYDKFERKGSGKQFAFSINSDGVYVSIHLKQTAQSSVMNDYGFRICDENRYESINLNGKTIVGIDPGKSQVFCAVSNKERRCLSINQWYYLLVPNGPKYLDYAKTSVERFKTAYDFYGSVKWRKLLWWKHIRKQFAYNFVCKKLCFGKPADSVVLAFVPVYDCAYKAQPPTMLTRKRTRSQRLDSDPEDDPQDQDYNPEDDMQVDEQNNQLPKEFQARPYEYTYSIKCGLRTLIKQTTIRKTFQTHVQIMNSIMYHGSRLLNLYLVQQLSRNDDIVLLNCSFRGKLRHFFAIICQGSRKKIETYDPGIVEALRCYKEKAISADVELPSCTGLTNTLNNAVSGYETSLQLHITQNIHKRTIRWISHVFEQMFPECFENQKRSTEGAKYVINLVESIWEPKSSTNELPAKLKSFITSDERRIRCFDVLRIAAVLLMEQTFDKGLRLEKTFVENNWEKFFPLLYFLLKYNNLHSETDAATRMTEQRTGRGLRFFNMAPLSSRSCSYILFDTSSFCEVITAASKKNHKSMPSGFPVSGNIVQICQQVRKNHHKYWGMVINWSALKTNKERFSGSIRTDGVTVVVHFKRTEYTKPVHDDGFRKTDKTYERIEVSGKTVVGLDPGRKDIFTCHDGEKKVHCSNREWQEISGANFQKKKHVFWLKKEPDIENINASMPSSKVSNVKDFLHFLDYELKNSKKLLSFYGSKRWRQLRRKSDIQKQKAYDVVCKRIAGPCLDSVVAYASGPTKSLLKNLIQRKVTVRMVWEHRTSVVCSKCKLDLPKGKNWRVKFCRNCKIHLNRDVNAAKNIRFIFLEMDKKDGTRPLQFRTFKERTAGLNSIESCVVDSASLRPTPPTPNDEILADGDRWAISVVNDSIDWNNFVPNQGGDNKT